MYVTIFLLKSLHYRLVTVSSGAHAHPSAIALRYIQRRILMSDPNWNNGHYYGKKFPAMGMQHARYIVANMVNYINNQTTKILICEILFYLNFK